MTAATTSSPSRAMHDDAYKFSTKQQRKKEHQLENNGGLKGRKKQKKNKTQNTHIIFALNDNALSFSLSHCEFLYCPLLFCKNHVSTKFKHA